MQEYGLAQGSVDNMSTTPNNYDKLLHSWKYENDPEYKQMVDTQGYIKGLDKPLEDLLIDPIMFAPNVLGAGAKWLVALSAYHVNPYKNIADSTIQDVGRREALKDLGTGAAGLAASTSGLDVIGKGLLGTGKKAIVGETKNVAPISLEKLAAENDAINALRKVAPNGFDVIPSKVFQMVEKAPKEIKSEFASAAKTYNNAAKEMDSIINAGRQTKLPLDDYIFDVRDVFRQAPNSLPPKETLAKLLEDPEFATKYTHLGDIDDIYKAFEKVKKLERLKYDTKDTMYKTINSKSRALKTQRDKAMLSHEPVLHHKELTKELEMHSKKLADELNQLDYTILKHKEDIANGTHIGDGVYLPKNMSLDEYNYLVDIGVGDGIAVTKEALNSLMRKKDYLLKNKTPKTKAMETQLDKLSKTGKYVKEPQVKHQTKQLTSSGAYAQPPRQPIN